MYQEREKRDYLVAEMNYDDLVRRLKEEMFCYCVSPYLTGTANWKRCAVCQAIDAIQELQKDAMRYRWLRDVGNTGFVALANVPDRAFKGPMGADAVDKAIDEAMQHEA